MLNLLLTKFSRIQYDDSQRFRAVPTRGFFGNQLRQVVRRRYPRYPRTNYANVRVRRQFSFATFSGRRRDVRLFKPKRTRWISDWKIRYAIFCCSLCKCFLCVSQRIEKYREGSHCRQWEFLFKIKLCDSTVTVNMTTWRDTEPTASRAVRPGLSEALKAPHSRCTSGFRSTIKINIQTC